MPENNNTNSTSSIQSRFSVGSFSLNSGKSTASVISVKNNVDISTKKSKSFLYVVKYLVILILGFSLLALIIKVSNARVSLPPVDKSVDIEQTEKELKNFIEDGVCDDVTNNADFLFDGGDCCQIDCKEHNSTQATAFCNCKDCICFSNSYNEYQVGSCYPLLLDVECNEETGNCSDIDECLINNGNCTGWLLCFNHFGHYTCECPDGFSTEKHTNDICLS